jgi:hypothetical protein
MKMMELTIYGRGETGLFVNRFNCYNTTLSEVTNASQNLIEQLGYAPGAPTAPVASSILAAYMALAPIAFSLTQLYCRDIYNVNDFTQVQLSGSGWDGARSGVNAVGFTSAKLRSTRNRQDIKSGTKAMIYPKSADVLSPAGDLSPAYIALLATLCIRLGNGMSPFVGVTTAFFGWSIFQKVEYTTPRGKRAYKYYPDPVDQAAHITAPVTWNVVERIGSQESRKFGKGR